MLVLLACAGVDDADSDTGAALDTGAAPSLADVDAAWVGEPSDGAGSALAGVGDVDADGAADVAIAAFYGNTVCVEAYVAGVHLLSDGVCVTGENVYDFFGYAVAPLGDVDSDGHADVLVGAIGSDEAGSEAGQVYLLAGPWTDGTAVDAVSSYTGELGGDFAGITLTSAGDVDGDGVDDVLVASSGSDAGGAGSGRVHLVRGPLVAGTHSLRDAWASYTGDTSTPAALAHGSLAGGDALGDAIAALGDVDGDGLDDLLLGGSGADEGGADAGVAWLVRGPSSSGDHRKEGADARLIGPVAGAFLGGALVGPGDLDGDGLADLAVAADAYAGGRVYVLAGPVADGAQTLSEGLAAWDGVYEGDVAGWSLARAGDTDGDGQRELWVGAPGLDAAGADGGGVYLVRAPATPGVHSLGDAELWSAEAEGDSAGRAVGYAGDVNGDGRDDGLVGALYNQDGGVFAGKGYLILGE